MRKKPLILAAFMGLALGVTGTYAAVTNFKDVPLNHWALNAVNWAKDAGLVEGYKDGTFQGDKNLSRYEMVQILSKYEGMKNIEMADLEKELMDKMALLEGDLSATDGIDIKNQLTQAESDINGDGTMDKVKLEVVDGGVDQYTLYVNDTKVTGSEVYLQNYFRIVDIDKNDKYLEILVGAEGPSNDPVTHFYSYNGSSIIDMGLVGSVYKNLSAPEDETNMNFDGNGTFDATVRGTVLQTWGYEAEYGLDANHKIKNLPKDLYPMGTEVTMLKGLPLQTSRTDSKNITTLQVGEKATLVSSDDKQWVLAKNSKGVEGWFEVEGQNIKALNTFSIYVFDGLSMAD